MPPRKEMIVALNSIVVPVLRHRGFTGSFPHFRRLGTKQIDLITFQFDKWGGGFVVELSKCGRITSYNVCYTKLLRSFRGDMS